MKDEIIQIDGKFYKQCEVVMFPTERNIPCKNSIIKSNITNKLNIFDPYGIGFLNKDKNQVMQHLYILSSEEIKEGDWYISAMKSIISQHNGTEKLPDGWKKIIATTDKSLKVPIDKAYMNFGETESLPHTSDSFIEKYVEEYNKENIITEVMVEYDYRVKSGTIDEHKKGLAGYEYFELKVNPKDNTITIRKTKDSWNREEVIELMAKAFYTDCRVWKNKYQDWEEVDFNEWIEKNL